MKNLLNKEIRLSASPLSWFFLTAALLTLVPGYPILLSAFFLCFGIFHSFQNGRETNDILYSALLPVPKGDVVRVKYAFTCMIQLIGFVLMALLTTVRMVFLGEAEVYRNNALMNAGPLFLAIALLIFCAFNTAFLGGFFKTAYRIGLPFLAFGIVTLVLIALGESLHHIPGLSFLNTPSGERLGPQFLFLAAAALIYALGTWLSCHSAVKRFEVLDL